MPSVRILIFIAVFAAGCASAPNPKPAPERAPSTKTATAAKSAPTSSIAAPIARAAPAERVLHGERFVDDYFWLRKKGDPEVEAYLRAEDAYARSVLAPTRPLVETLYK